MAVAKQFGPEAESQLWLVNPDLAELTAWRPATTAKLINSAQLASLPSGLERRAAELEQRGLNGLTLPHGDWSGGRVALLHRFELLALGRGAEFEREMAELVDAGIDGLYSDRVDRMAAVVDVYYPDGATGSGPR